MWQKPIKPKKHLENCCFLSANQIEYVEPKRKEPTLKVLHVLKSSSEFFQFISHHFGVTQYINNAQISDFCEPSDHIYQIPLNRLVNTETDRIEATPENWLKYCGVYTSNVIASLIDTDRTDEHIKFVADKNFVTISKYVGEAYVFTGIPPEVDPIKYRIIPVNKLPKTISVTNDFQSWRKLK